MMKTYLMPLYYPTTAQSVQGLPLESPDPDSRSLSGPAQSGSPPASTISGQQLRNESGGDSGCCDDIQPACCHQKCSPWRN